MSNPFDQFDGGQPQANPFDQFDPHVRAANGATPSPTNMPGETPDQAAARKWLDANPQAQHGFGNNMLAKVAQGATFGWGDEMLAGAASVRDAVKHGGMPWDYYAREKAMQDEQLRRANESTGNWGTAAEIAGGIGTGIGASGAGITAMRAGQGLGARALAGALEGAAYGGLAGAGTADSGVGNTVNGALKGAAMGGVAGGAMPVVVSGVKAMASPLVSNIHARVNPRGYAESQLAKTLERSGRTAGDVTSAMNDAAAAGQGNYVLADALGESGQKQLAGLMKSPGQVKQQAAEWLAARNHGMGRNVQGFVDDAFNTHGNTAQEFTDLMTAARSKAGDVRYGAARAGAGPVDLTDTLSVVQDIRDPAGVLSGPSVTRAQSAAPGDVEKVAALLGREGLGDTTAANFDLLLNAKGDIGDIASEAARAGRGNAATQVSKIKRSLDAALSNASPGYRRANDTFSRMSRPIDAVPMGQKAATSGRAADTINKFNSMGRPAQQGFRVGYADKLNQSLGGPSVGGKVNEMLHGDVADEIAALATPGKAQRFTDQLRRVSEMIRTGNAANGGSPTAELLSQQADIGIDPIAAAGNLASGNFGSALKNMAGGFMNGMNGNTEAVRNQLIPMLLSGRVGNTPPVNLNGLLQALEARNLASQARGAAVRRGVSSGVVPALVGDKK